MILAQSESPDMFDSGVLKVVEYVRTFDFPSCDQYITDLTSVDTLVAVALVLGGVALLLFGFKYFKLFVIANAAIAGALIGMYIGVKATNSDDMPALLGLAGAVLFGALAYPLLKYAVCLMGAIAGGILGYGLWRFVAHAVRQQDWATQAWVGGIIGLILVGMLAWIAFRMAVTLFTSLQGSIMVTSGVLAILLCFASVREAIQDPLSDNPIAVYLLLGVPAALGFAFQESKAIAKIKKKRKVSEKPPI